MKSSSEKVVRSSDSDRVLVIMAKAPRPGAVKTRLAPSLSPEAVTAFYCCLLDDTLALARSLGDVEVAIMCPESDVNELAQLAGNQASVVAQKGEGLAAGLTSVFAHFARRSSKGRPSTTHHCLQQRQPTPAAFCSRRRVRNAGRTRCGRWTNPRRRLLSRRRKGFSSYAFRKRRNGHQQRAGETPGARTRP